MRESRLTSIFVFLCLCAIRLGYSPRLYAVRLGRCPRTKKIHKKTGNPKLGKTSIRTPGNAVVQSFGCTVALVALVADESRTLAFVSLPWLGN